MKIVNTQVTRSNTRKIVVKSVEKDVATDRLIINLEGHLMKSTDYTLELFFDGNITDSLNGFYKSSYVDADKQTRQIAITHFEPAAARSAFPCFDEPHFKAKFEISVAHPDNLTALSNMPVVSQEPMLNTPGWKWTHFDRSVKMSTYLVAYGIVDFKYLETSYVSKDNETKVIRVWARSNLIHQAQYALSIAPKLLVLYEDLFGLPYVLKKLDLIAIPDFSVGAMENWGLITFRETALLYDEASNSVADKQVVAQDIAHELAHQWFGNLVTMEWWTDLWLNEGFATYVQYLGANYIEPQWKMLDSLSQSKMTLLRSDALGHTTPVSMVVADESEIAQKFDSISYNKGASLIRMLNYTITESVFRKGLKAYLNKWKFSNAREDDLWASMTETVASAPMSSVHGESIVEFMVSWTHQAGYPAVTVVRNQSTGNVSFVQNLFTAVASSSRKDPIWQIPITYAIVDENSNSSNGMEWDVTPKFWLKSRDKSVKIELSASQALYVNVDSIGYYRVNYDTSNWNKLAAILSTKSTLVPPIARAQLIDDAFNLAKVGQLPYKVALNLTAYLREEQSRLVWEVVLGNIAFIRYNLMSSHYYGDFQDYILYIIDPTLIKYKYGVSEQQTDEETLLAQNMLEWECACGSERCIDWARDLFKQWMNSGDIDKNPIPVRQRSLVYSTALKYGGRQQLELLWRALLNSSDPGNREQAAAALGSAPSELVTLILHRALTDMPAQYADSSWNFESPSACRIAREFFVENWKKIYVKYSKFDSQVFSAILDAVFNGITTQSELDKFKQFVEENYDELKPYKQGLLMNADTAALRIKWLKQYTEQLGTWLREFNLQSKAKKNNSAVILERAEKNESSSVPTIETSANITETKSNQPDTSTNITTTTNVNSTSVDSTKDNKTA